MHCTCSTICNTKIHIPCASSNTWPHPPCTKKAKSSSLSSLSYNIASTESGKSRLNLRLHRKMGTLFHFPNAFAASALMMALSTLLVTMHVDFVMQLGIIFNILKCEFMCYTVHNVFCYGFVQLLSSVVHFCPNGYACGNVRKPAILHVCIIHSDDDSWCGWVVRPTP